MSELSPRDRFEELEAGRILGDLSEEEVREWKDLSKSLPARPDFSLELTAAAVESEFLLQKDVSIPGDMAQRLRRVVLAQAPRPSSQDDRIIRPTAWQRVLGARETAWAIAAALVILFVVTFLTKPSSSDRSPEVAVKMLEKEARDLLKLNFAGLGKYDKLKGEVLWSDQKQEGYMVLTNLPANNPTKNQYQLWIVDPTRDEKPVDGGVFDIPSGQSTAVVPIRNPLTVSSPQAFVITLEQPGGVVVSKQEVVVALAKPS